MLEKILYYILVLILVLMIPFSWFVGLFAVSAGGYFDGGLWCMHAALETFLLYLMYKCRNL